MAPSGFFLFTHSHRNRFHPFKLNVELFNHSLTLLFNSPQQTKLIGKLQNSHYPATPTQTILLFSFLGICLL